VIFLIEYDRSEGRTVTLTPFEDSERSEAENARLNLELDLNRKGVEHEVVVIQAADLEALRKTHRRYFSDLWEHVLGAGTTG
jgi:hypothetical protein